MTTEEALAVAEAVQFGTGSGDRSQNRRGLRGGKQKKYPSGDPPPKKLKDIVARQSLGYKESRGGKIQNAPKPAPQLPPPRYGPLKPKGGRHTITIHTGGGHVALSEDEGVQLGMTTEEALAVAESVQFGLSRRKQRQQGGQKQKPQQAYREQKRLAAAANPAPRPRPDSKNQPKSATGTITSRRDPPPPARKGAKKKGPGPPYQPTTNSNNQAAERRHRAAGWFSGKKDRGNTVHVHGDNPSITLSEDGNMQFGRMSDPVRPHSSPLSSQQPAKPLPAGPTKKKKPSADPAYRQREKTYDAPGGTPRLPPRPRRERKDYGLRKGGGHDITINTEGGHVALSEAEQFAEATKGRYDAAERGAMRRAIYYANIHPAIKVALLQHSPAVQFSDAGDEIPSVPLSWVMRAARGILQMAMPT